MAGRYNCSHALGKAKVYEAEVLYLTAECEFGKYIKRKWICKHCYSTGYTIIWHEKTENEYDILNRLRMQKSEDLKISPHNYE